MKKKTRKTQNNNLDMAYLKAQNLYSFTLQAALDQVSTRALPSSFLHKCLDTPDAQHSICGIFCFDFPNLVRIRMLFHRDCPPGSFSLNVVFSDVRVAIWVPFTDGQLYLHMKRASLIVEIKFLPLASD